MIFEWEENETSQNKIEFYAKILELKLRIYLFLMTK